MEQNILLDANVREESGKNAMKRLRRSGFVPGIVFGRSGETTPVSFRPRDLEKIIHSDSGFNTIFSLNIAGTKKTDNPNVIIKEYQVDPVTHEFLHVSFYRIHMDRIVEVAIPIVTQGTAPGVKIHGGTLDMVMREVEVSCLPANIPDAIVIDISTFELHHTVRISDLLVTEEVKLLGDPDSVVLHIAPPKRVVEVVEVEEGVEEEEGEEAAGEEETE